MADGWTHTESPFHVGEQDIQARRGVRDRIEGYARRVIRDYLPDQHREFYAQLPFALIGSVDENGCPWASLIAGEPGFMTSPTPKRLAIAARPLYGDPLTTALKMGGDIAMLGIEPATRRRNRLTGRVDAVAPDGFAIAIDQSFGNCPQYIQTRDVELLAGATARTPEPPIIRSDRFDDGTRSLIERSDTVFIATAYTADRTAASNGADVSHRGGKPGFVRVEGDRSFVFPDFSGNNHFNTVGNILLNPRAGFLFIDFEARDLVYMTGAADIVCEGEELVAFAGAERLIRFQADEIIRVEGSLPLSFAFGEYSPMLEHTGNWAQAAETIAAERERNIYLLYEIVDIQPESEEITSFHLRRADGKAPAVHEPGQFLPIRMQIPGADTPAMRTYTISDTPNGETYRLSIKREGGGALVSNFLHDHAAPGFRLEAMAPRGKFVLDRSSDRPVVLISGGVGITPMIAMVNSIISEGERTRQRRRTYFIHGARNCKAHAFGSHLHELAARHDNLTAHIRYSHPDPADRLGDTHDSEGFVDIDLLKRVLPLDDYEYYLCGPPPFMQSLYDGLIGIGVRNERIHYESFGPATVLRRDTETQPSGSDGERRAGPIAVSFAASGIATSWTPAKGTLLELAEASGLAPAFACRSGICGTCATRIKCGSVDYVEEPSAPRADDEVLICCATPRAATGEDSCGEEQGVVLEL